MGLPRLLKSACFEKGGTVVTSGGFLVASSTCYGEVWTRVDTGVYGFDYTSPFCMQRKATLPPRLGLRPLAVLHQKSVDLTLALGSFSQGTFFSKVTSVREIGP